MKVFANIKQGSEEWFAKRKGRPTASRFSDIITAATGTAAKTARKSYINELIAECFCPEWEKWAGNYATDRGQELEPAARDAFVAHTGLTVQQVGFVTRDDEIVGCSPDGLIVGPDGQYIAGLELKCPAPHTHVSYVLNQQLPNQYKQQVHGGMAVTGLNRWHFFSWYPGLQPFHLVVRRDVYTEQVAEEIDAFLTEYGKAREAALPQLQRPPTT